MRQSGLGRRRDVKGRAARHLAATPRGPGRHAGRPLHRAVRAARAPISDFRHARLIEVGRLKLIFQARWPIKAAIPSVGEAAADGRRGRDQRD